MYVVPRPILEKARTHPLVNALTPTDIGWFPAARYHYRERPAGAPEHILIYCTEGRGWCEIDGDRQSVRQNQAIIIPKQRPHVYGAANDDPWSIHWVHFVGTSGDYYVGQLQKGAYTLSIDVAVKASLEDLFCACRDAFVASFLLPRMIYASQTLHHLLGHLFFNNRAFSPLLGSSRFRSTRCNTLCLPAPEYERASSRWQDMVQHSRDCRSRILFGCSKSKPVIRQWIILSMLKMQHACMLLAFREDSIAQIAMELGYRDPYYFSRAFRKVIGISPTDYRRTTYN